MNATTFAWSRVPISCGWKARVLPTVAKRPVGVEERRTNVTWGLKTPSVPPENIVMAEEGIRGSQTWVARVREKSLTQPFPVIVSLVLCW